MWKKLPLFILRNRLGIAITLGIFTLVLGSQVTRIKRSYRETNLLPDRDSTTLRYRHFRKVFGQEDNLVVLGLQRDSLFSPAALRAWESLAAEIRKEKRVQRVLAISDLKVLYKDTARKRFALKPLSPELPP